MKKMDFESMFYIVMFNIVPLLLIICGTILGICEIEGWGWMILLSLIMYTSPKNLKIKFIKANKELTQK